VTLRPVRGLAVLALLAATAAGAADVAVPGTKLRVDASGYLDGLAVADTGGGPRERPQAIAEVRFESRLTRALRAHLTLRGRAGGPFEGGHPGVFNLVHEFQNRTPSLELNEAWLEARQGDLQVRAGVQKFAWGKLDGVPPTDVLTPRDLHDPIVRDFEESKIGIPAVAGTYFLPPAPSLDLSDLRATLVYLPIAVPPRLALAEERWFPPTVAVDRQIFISQADAARLGFPVALRTLVDFHTLNHRPPARLDAGGVALRLGGAWRGMDWDLYHYTGPETAPDADLLATLKGDGVHVDPRTGKQFFRIRARSDLRQAHDVIHMSGLDASAVFGGATVRAEGAFFVGRPYLRPSADLFSVDALAAIPRPVVSHIVQRLTAGKSAALPLGDLFPSRDSAEWGVGADYLVHGFLPLVQVNEIVFLDHGPEQLYSNPETRFLGSLKKSFLQDTLECEVRAVYAIERRAWYVYPRISYRYRDNWRFRLGYLAIGGPLESYIGQFHRNDEVVLEARYSF
jgi:hypothetical protein